MTRGLIFSILLVILAGGVQAQGGAQGSSALRMLMTGDDSRGWQAVGRLNIAGRSFCTGALIAPDLVLTAAHCMYDMETGLRVDDAEVQFLADLRGGRAAAYRGVRRSIVHPGFAVTDRDFSQRVAHDLAILELDQPIRNASITPFSTRTRPVEGAEVGVVSYAHDRAESPSLQELCHVLARHGGSLVLSCDVDHGSSGAPIFVVEDGSPRIVSVVSAKASVSGKPVALGTALQQPLAELLALREAGDGVFRKTPPPVRRLSLNEAHSDIGAKFLRP